MCDGVSAVMGVGMALSLAGSIYSAIQQDDATSIAKKNTEAAAETAAKNAQSAEYAASDAIARGAQDSALIRRKGAAMVGAQRVGFAANNIDPFAGSAIEVSAQTRALAELDAMIAENNAAREAWGYRRQGSNFMAQSIGQQAQASYLRDAAGYQMAGTLLGTAGSLTTQGANAYMMYQRNKLPTYGAV